MEEIKILRHAKRLKANKVIYACFLLHILCNLGVCGGTHVQSHALYDKACICACAQIQNRRWKMGNYEESDYFFSNYNWHSSNSEKFEKKVQTMQARNQPPTNPVVTGGELNFHKKNFKNFHSHQCWQTYIGTHPILFLENCSENKASS